MEKKWLKNYPRDVPETAEYPDVPMCFYVDDAASKFPDKTALIFVNKKI
ncbi:MAG: hypothetical protein HXS44_11245, partial [Theionarchaea archaeon]|nr:hypothetical protein [Theionarchaea archaeon]